MNGLRQGVEKQEIILDGMLLAGSLVSCVQAACVAGFESLSGSH